MFTYSRLIVSEYVGCLLYRQKWHLYSEITYHKYYEQDNDRIMSHR
ncbi:hypothetical protein NT01EI_2107 [Edwardsiella ictaluri 93-146]|uniref:Uncharacterized protein n=1 Tax=Edwardsiella ictaluri (strain 93-146) TaxID=634503 RepID=C5BE42_EDWI9|nr:hypothetical protein NT01EI_2107 [Edwardsiella ictaluri 93-146]